MYDIYNIYAQFFYLNFDYFEFSYNMIKYIKITFLKLANQQNQIGPIGIFSTNLYQQK